MSKYTKENFLGKTEEQSQSLADFFNQQQKGIEDMGYEIGVLQEVIFKLTGMDSIDAVTKVYGRDIVAEKLGSK